MTIPEPEPEDLAMLIAIGSVRRELAELNPADWVAAIAEHLKVTPEEANRRLDQFVCGFGKAFLEAHVER
jgi:hypothetical protein